VAPPVRRFPQRDERLGWTGDIQVFAPTATFLFD
jgi:alpha-L-rhamnosidase